MPKTPPSSRRSKDTSRSRSALTTTLWPCQSHKIETIAIPSRLSLAQSASVVRRLSLGLLSLIKTRGTFRNLTCFCVPLALSQRRSPSQATLLSRLRSANRRPRHRLVRKTPQLRAMRHQCPLSASRMTIALRQALESPIGPLASTSCRCK